MRFHPAMKHNPVNEGASLEAMYSAGKEKDEDGRRKQILKQEKKINIKKTSVATNGNAMSGIIF
jgi:hypothetical protein